MQENSADVRMLHFNNKHIWKLFLCVILVFAPVQLFSSQFKSSCNDFTIDKCNIDPGGLLETVKDISERNCQFYCNVIYKDKCTFFIYDRKEVLCELIEEPYDNYVHTCDKYGGPVHPSISECYDSDDDCKVS